ncbi:C39 family peptidase [Amycolatopsis alba]|uniref:Lysis protein n=1 Tax=Amycolatopsis alba DSM 44262 TaxID=1125972 RepID=A0A229RY74_AMYAL|nr:C39 family peptidase [Amycolatopsis alba]OXM51638.1 lysis protein [Amycolatopsis alba DSM 44262]
MRRLRTAVVAALAVSALITAPAVAVAQEKYADPGFVNSMAPPAKVEGVRATAELDIQYQIQETGYWCGPAATRIAISAKNGNPPSQQQLANELPTSTNGTDWIGQVTRVLNAHIGGGWYETKEMPNDPPTQAQRDLLWRDIVLDVDKGYALVANIVAPANNHPPGYPNYTIYHYFTIIGYNSDNMTVKIADPANFGGNQIYWLTFNQLATLIPPKGYSA